VSPIKIVITPTGAHLADYHSEVAYCGADVKVRPSFALEPGSDFGEHKDDCRKCMRELRSMAGGL
jgi:hypothetical protein